MMELTKSETAISNPLNTNDMRLGREHIELCLAISEEACPPLTARRCFIA